MNKISALWQLFKVGQSVVDPVKWKQRQVTATVFGAVILAVVNLLAVFGFSIPIDTETATLIAGGVIAVVNVVLTYTTSDKIGVGKVEPEVKQSTQDESIKDSTSYTFPDTNN